MYQWIRRLFEREKPDFVIAQFIKNDIFRIVPENDVKNYPESFSGFKRIAVLTALVAGGCNKLSINLRIYRSSDPEYLYLFAWSFGDNDVPDNLFKSIHSSPKAYFAKDLVEVVRMIRRSGEVVRAMHNVYLSSRTKQQTALLASK